MKLFCVLSIVLYNLVLIGQVTFRIDTVLDLPSRYVDQRPLYILVPQGQFKTPFKAIYLHDGQMLFDSTSTWNNKEWNIDESMNLLSNQFGKEPFLVVGIPNNGAYRKSEYFPEKVFHSLSDSLKQALLLDEWKGRSRSDQFMKYLVEEVVPYIESHYPISHKNKDRYIGGSSSGASAALYAFCEYPTVFRNAICFSTHWPGSLKHVGPEIPNAWLKYLEKHLPKPKKRSLYMDHGTIGLDSLYGPLQEQVDLIIRKKGYDQSFVSKVFIGDDHSEPYWGKRFLMWLEEL